MSMSDSPTLPSQVRHVLLVTSGKGGVGKSMVAHALALSLVRQGHKVGLLDVDLCGPSIPRLLGLEKEDVRQCPEGWVPIFAGPPGRESLLKVMSIAFLLTNKDDPVVWRGPKKNSMISQFLCQVFWQDLDYLVIDTPPGTSDEIMSVVEKLKSEYQGVSPTPFGAVLVTTPQNASLADVRRQFTFCAKTGLPVIGLVENMAFFQCPHCSDCSKVFSSGGGESLSKLKSVPLLARVPIVPGSGQRLDQGSGLREEAPEGEGDREPLVAALAPAVAQIAAFWSPAE